MIDSPICAVRAAWSLSQCCMDGMLHAPAFRLTKLARPAERRTVLYQQPRAIVNPVAPVGLRRLRLLAGDFQCLEGSCQVILLLLYSDDTGRFPVRARSDNQYVMIAYHTVGNLILQQAFPTKADKHRIPAFNNIMTRLMARGISVDLIIRDNEASADIKKVITETWRAKFQLVPPDMHRRNKAE